MENSETRWLYSQTLVKEGREGRREGWRDGANKGGGGNREGFRVDLLWKKCKCMKMLVE